jgi:O-antigen ligase
MSLRLDNVIAVGVLLALCVAALAHGTVEFWSVAVLQILLAILVLLWGIKMMVDYKLSLTIPPFFLPLTGFLLLGIFQSFNLGNKSLSADLEATRGTVSILLALIVYGLLGANFLANRERLRVTATFLSFWGLAISVFALLQYFTWNGKFYWFRPALSDLSSPFGPFANHNHFAGYVELLIGLPIGLIVSSGVRKDERLFYGFVTVVIGVALVISLSRGGMVGFLAGAIFIALLSSKLKKEHPTRRSVKNSSMKGLAVLGIIGAIIASLFWIGADPVVNRIVDNRETLSSSRTWIWKDAWNVFTSHPITGAGLGSFQTVFPQRSEYDGSWGYVAQAHNDYLQVLADSGIIGGVLMIWFMMLVLQDIFRGVRSNDPLLAGIALGCGGGIVALLVHSLIDFNLQLPSNSMLFLLLCSMAAYCSQKVLDQETKIEILPQPEPNPRRVGV